MCMCVHYMDANINVNKFWVISSTSLFTFIKILLSFIMLLIYLTYFNNLIIHIFKYY